MKQILYVAVGLITLNCTSGFGQPAPPVSRMPPAPNEGVIGPKYYVPDNYILVRATNSLPKFDMDFPGGTPVQLVRAIEKASGKPLNAVIPDDCTDLKMPAFSVKNVTVAQVFQALEQVSRKTERFTVLDPRDRAIGGNGSDVYTYTSSYGFRTEGVPTENSIWFFFWDQGKEHAPWQVLSSKVCKFYQLKPYLEAGHTVDDITTAVDTGWKMLGVTNPPEITYHKDTDVLIAVGEEDKVNLIGDMLKQLPQGKPEGKSGNNQTEKSGN